MKYNLLRGWLEKLHSNRNFCSRFEQEYPDWGFETLQRRHFQARREPLDKWEDFHETALTSEQVDEKHVIIKALSNYKAFALGGGILFADGKPVTFTMGKLV